MDIVELSPKEAFIVNDLAHRIWPETFKDILSPEQLSYMLNWMYSIETLQQQMAKGHRFFVIKENQEPLGFIGVQPHYPLKGQLKIHKLYVLPNQQGKGLGKQLIDFVISLARKHQIEKLTLNVNRFNKAVAFYKHIGFTIAFEENIEIGNGYLMEDYVMELELYICKV
jgi:ribosomal protein S18 acetylase RimI-like enzyme